MRIDASGHYSKRNGINFKRGECQSFEQRVELFWTLVKAEQWDGCWEWQGGLTKKGYGMFYCQGREVLAHRFAWLAHHGSITKLFVCHSCDNRKCCNPSHLFQGTNSDNMKDMVSKLRQSTGSKHPMSHLTHEQAVEIQKSPDTTKSLAERYGVSMNCIYRARTGRRYKHEQQLWHA